MQSFRVVPIEGDIFLPAAGESFLLDGGIAALADLLRFQAWPPFPGTWRTPKGEIRLPRDAPVLPAELASGVSEFLDFQRLPMERQRVLRVRPFKFVPVPPLGKNIMKDIINLVVL